MPGWFDNSSFLSHSASSLLNFKCEKAKRKDVAHLKKNVSDVGMRDEGRKREENVKRETVTKERWWGAMQVLALAYFSKQNAALLPPLESLDSGPESLRSCAEIVLHGLTELRVLIHSSKNEFKESPQVVFKRSKNLRDMLKPIKSATFIDVSSSNYRCTGQFYLYRQKFQPPNHRENN